MVDEMKNKKQKVCRVCITEFTPTHGNQKYCSSSCRYLVRLGRLNRFWENRYHEERRRLLKTKFCPMCNDEFVPVDGDQKYCSQVCEVKAIELRKRVPRLFGHLKDD